MRKILLLVLTTFIFNSTAFAVCDPNLDSDLDGVNDCDDSCPNDQYKTEPLSCGCGLLDLDFNADGSPECVDPCEFDSSKFDGGLCDCPLFEVLKVQIGFSFPCQRAPLNPRTVIAEPPGVIVFQESDGSSSVKLVFEKFAGAVSVARSSAQAAAALSAPSELGFQSEALRVGTRSVKLKVRYDVLVTPEDIKANLIRKSSKRAELTLKGLKPGNYNAKYRAHGTQDDKTVFKTKFSPSRSFNIPG